MAYLSIMIAPVKTADREAYLAHAHQMWPLFQKHGALGLQEQWSVDVPDGHTTSFPMSVKLEEGESIAVGWIIWPDRETHDRAWEVLDNDPEMMAHDLPFDGRRMVFGGFETILDLKA